MNQICSKVFGLYMGISIKLSLSALPSTALINKAFILLYQGILVNFLNHKSLTKSPYLSNDPQG